MVIITSYSGKRPQLSEVQKNLKKYHTINVINLTT